MAHASDGRWDHAETTGLISAEHGVCALRTIAGRSAPPHWRRSSIATSPYAAPLDCLIPDSRDVLYQYVGERGLPDVAMNIGMSSVSSEDHARPAIYISAGNSPSVVRP